MQEGRKPECPEKTPYGELQKLPHTEARKIQCHYDYDGDDDGDLDDDDDEDDDDDDDDDYHYYHHYCL